MNYRLVVWLLKEQEIDPILDTIIIVDEDLDKDLLDVVSSSLKTAFEIIYNVPVEIEFYKGKQ